MRVTYDEEADALYLYLSQRKVAKTVPVSGRVNVDLDREGNLRGLEVLFASKALRHADFSHVRMQLPRIGEIDIKLPAATSA